MKSHTNATNLFADAENVLAGRATKTTKLMADQGTAFDKTGKSAERAAGTAGGTGLGALIGGGGAGGGGMAALIIAGVALSPVLLTVGTGLAGFGAAAVAAAAPILKASQATGGLAKNMATLDPEQKKVAIGILGLGQQFDKFEKALQPQVLAVFNQGIKLTGNLLRDVQPVAKVTGAALGGLIGAIDKEFRSQTWQQFFGFMARTAGPDMKLLQQSFIALLDALPPLIQGLQPVAVALLNITKDGAQALDILTHFPGVVTGSGLALDSFHAKATAASGSVKLFSGSTGAAITKADQGTGVLSAFGHAIGFINTLSQGAHLWLGLATGNIKASGTAAYEAAPKVFHFNAAITALNTSMTTLVGNLLTLQGSNLSWQQSMQAAEAQLKTNTAGLEGNSKNALANKQAVLASTQAAISFAQTELVTGRNINGASRTVADQIRWLQGLHDKSAFVRDEIAALQHEEAKLAAQKMNQRLSVIASGTWTVSGSQHFGQRGQTPTAKGWLVSGGTPGVDSVPILAMPGEAIVPRHLTPAVAPFLKAHGVPGFAAGGIIPSYSGTPGGMTPWVAHNDAATIRLIDLAVVKATLAGIHAAQSVANRQFSGGGGGGSGAAIARAMFPWPSWEWGDFNYLEMREAGYQLNATNPSSGAYGVAQFINGPSEYYQYGGNPNTFQGQFTGMFNYIRQRYGDPVVAAEHERAFNWYDQGGWLPPGLSLALNTTGRPERVGGGGGNTYVIHQHIPPTVNKADVGRATVEAIREFEKRSGAGWRK
jgi:hypothetical protein